MALDEKESREKKLGRSCICIVISLKKLVRSLEDAKNETLLESQILYNDTNLFKNIWCLNLIILETENWSLCILAMNLFK